MWGSWRRSLLSVLLSVVDDAGFVGGSAGSSSRNLLGGKEDRSAMRLEVGCDM